MTPAQIKRAKAMRNDGRNFDYIGVKLGVAANTVRNHLCPGYREKSRRNARQYRDANREFISAARRTPEFRLQRKLRAAGVVTP